MSFRPLLGFFIFQSNGNILTLTDRNGFPSPIGVLYISITYKNYIELNGTKVSVPYWGSLYFNENQWSHVQLFQHRFRPLLGFFIFQFDNVEVTEKLYGVSVPY